jgi:hypothetical protein
LSESPSSKRTEFCYNIRANLDFDAEANVRPGDIGEIALVKKQRLVYSNYFPKSKGLTLIVVNSLDRTES